MAAAAGQTHVICYLSVGVAPDGIIGAGFPATSSGVVQRQRGCPQPDPTSGAQPGPCALNKTWQELVLLKVQGVGRVKSGGLGRCAEPPDVQVWQCADLAVASCLAGALQPQADLACFTYHERLAAFDWVGWNSRLFLIAE